jgi:hypothetical protein
MLVARGLQMKQALKIIVATGLFGMILGVRLIWAAAPPNPTVSDGSGNTAGGTDTLFNLTTGFDNTGLEK